MPMDPSGLTLKAMRDVSRTMQKLLRSHLGPAHDVPFDISSTAMCCWDVQRTFSASASAIGLSRLLQFHGDNLNGGCDRRTAQSRAEKHNSRDSRASGGLGPPSTLEFAMTTTPPNLSNSSPVHETSSVSQRTSECGYYSGQLDLTRHAVVQDLPSVPLIPHDFLFDKVLPPIPSSVDLEILKRDLRSEDVVRKNGWRGFETQPKNSTQTESEAFSPLVQVFNDVLKWVKPALQPVLKMTHSSDFATLSKRANSSQPDGLLKLRSVNTNPGKSNWEDIPVSMEFKKSNSIGNVHDVHLTLAHLNLYSSYSMPGFRIKQRSSGVYTI